MVGAVVSFKDHSGRTFIMNLVSADAALLAAAMPWRVFRWWQGQTHYSGWYWSATTGGHLVYESRLESARLLLADFDPAVAAIAAQPFCVVAEQDGTSWTERQELPHAARQLRRIPTPSETP